MVQSTDWRVQRCHSCRQVAATPSKTCWIGHIVGLSSPNESTLCVGVIDLYPFPLRLLLR